MSAPVQIERSRRNRPPKRRATFTVNGDYTDLSQTTRFSIGGRPATGGFGRLNVAGDATLTHLDVFLTNGFGPRQGDQYPIVSYGARQGELPALTGLDPYFAANIDATGVRLDVTQTAADLTVMANSINTPATVVPGTFAMEWPPKSGRIQEFPELDRVAWLPLDRARAVIVGAQAAFLDRLAEHSP